MTIIMSSRKEPKIMQLESETEMVEWGQRQTWNNVLYLKTIVSVVFILVNW